jgi:hypothetical protein
MEDTPEHHMSNVSGAMDLMMALDPILTAVTTYRERLLAAGIGSAAADEMTIEFHRAVLARAL